MDKKLLDILTCPMCNSTLSYIKDKKVLLCRFDRVAFPFDDDIPVLLPERADNLTAEQFKSYNLESDDD